jgi:hypothetical protein
LFAQNTDIAWLFCAKCHIVDGNAEHSVTKIKMSGAYTFLPKAFGSQAQQKTVLNPIRLRILRLRYWQ